MAYDPRWYLEESLYDTFKYFDTNGGTASDGTPIQANPLVALPCGTGKSWWIAEFIRRAFYTFPQTRIIMAVHVQELVQQNFECMLEAWPNAPIGINCSGLKQRQTDQPIIFGSIKSMMRDVEALGYRDIVIVDETHLVSTSSETMYQQFFAELRKKNPYLKIVGLSATIYRMGLGLLTNGNIFNDIVYNICDIKGFSRLLADGYLCPLIAKKTATQLDISNVGISNTGDFNENQLQSAVDVDSITFAALSEIVSYGQQRHAWMIFAAGIDHAEHVATMMNNVFGVPTGVVHSKSKDREKTINDYKAGHLRCIVGNNVLTTGFNYRPIDLIGMLRPTMSTGLWIQMLGRGTRPWWSKTNCLVLDFAGNTRRLGPINDPVIPRPKGQGKPGDAPVKICDCGVYNHASARACVACGAPFGDGESGPAIEGTAGTEELLRSDLPQIEMFDVMRVVYDLHTNREGSQSIKVCYYCHGLRTFYEYIKFEDAKPFAIHKAHDWLRQRTVYADGAIAHMEGAHMEGHRNEYVISGSDNFRIPRRISVWVNKPNPEVRSAQF